MRIFMKELWQFGYYLCYFRCSFSADTAVLRDFSYFSGNSEKSEKNWADAKLSVLYVKNWHIFLTSLSQAEKFANAAGLFWQNCCFGCLVDLLFS